MISEMRQSISAILYERVSSPLYGTLFFSWVIWNWQVVYLTFFVNGSESEVNKLQWIIKNYTDVNLLITYPLISTFFLVTVMPFITNGAYWLHIKFITWRVNQKNKIEMKSLLTLEQSIKLRGKIAESEAKIETLLAEKDTEIQQLKLQIGNLTKDDIKPNNETSEQNYILDDVSRFAEKISSNKDLMDTFQEAVEYAQGGYPNLVGSNNIESSALAFLEVNHLIQGDNGIYKITDLGRDVLKKILDMNY